MKRRQFYTLDENNNTVECSNIFEAEQFFENDRRIVKQSNVSGCFVSTVFLVINHNFSNDGEPVLFETMIFTKRRSAFKRLDQYQWRYTSYNSALKNHYYIVNQIQRKNLSRLYYGQ